MEINNPDGLSPNKRNFKENCYVFDFAPNRSLRLISDYSCRLSLSENKNPDQKVRNLFNFYWYYHMTEVKWSK